MARANAVIVPADIEAVDQSHLRQRRATRSACAGVVDRLALRRDRAGRPRR
jgi:hypothetical protein